MKTTKLLFTLTTLFIYGFTTAQTQIGLDIDGEAANNYSGRSVSMPNANTIAIGAPGNDGNDTDAGHVRVYTWNGSNWMQKGLDIDGEAVGNGSGRAVSMPDANTLAIGASSNDGGFQSGHVRIYNWNGSAWVQKGTDIDGEAVDDYLGYSVSMPDANTFAVGAHGNDGNGSNAGHVRIYSWNGSSWIQKGTDIDGEAAGDQSAWSISMPNANTLAVGALGNDGNGTNAGHVRIYSWNGSSWIQKGTDIDGEAAGDASGWSVSMPDDNTLAVGAPNNDGNGTNAGHVRIYSWNGSSWIQKGTDIDGEAANDFSGRSVSMPNANTIAIGAVYNTGNGTAAGHVRIYTWNGSSWVQKGADIDGEAANDLSGYSVSMPDANTLAVGAIVNDGNGADAGHVRVYSLCTPVTGTDVQTACNSYLWIDGNTYTANNTTAKDTIVGGAANGCDSIVTLNLTILNSATGTDVQTACNSYLWIDGNTYTANNTTAKDTLVGSAANGCDSIVTLNLTILNSATGTDVQTACNSYLWIDGNTYTANNTTAKDTLVGAAANGCDSIVTLNLTILNSATGTDVQTACNSYLWTDGNTYTANNNTAKDTIVGGAFNGCDSIVTLNLTIFNTVTATDTRTECSPFVWIDGNTYTSNNTTAKDTLVAGSVNGCDSIVTLNLTITIVDTSVTQTGTDLTANELVATYQWLDCDNNYAVIPGETFRTYYVLADGNYAVEVTYYGCADTSSCYNVIVSSVAENTVNSNITIYPNPVKNQLTITAENKKINNIKIIDVTGKILKTVVANTTTINVADLAKGLYILQVETANGVVVKRFIKE